MNGVPTFSFRNKWNSPLAFILIVGALLVLPGCSWWKKLSALRLEPFFGRPECPALSSIYEKWSLWAHGTCLRGANIWQKLTVFGEDNTIYGSLRIGPPYTQKDFNRLAEMGANVVVISHPGVFSIDPPYRVNREAQENLDLLLEMVRKSDLFAVIAFRTGPGRNEYAVTDPSSARALNRFWVDAEAQKAWIQMWETVASRYKNSPHVVGYDLMVEPNANSALYHIYDPNKYYPRPPLLRDDWNELSEQMAKQIRRIDSETPILIEAMNYASPDWISYLPRYAVPKIVKTTHFYLPDRYTQQALPPSSASMTYPSLADIGGTGHSEPFDKNWLSNKMTPLSQVMKNRSDSVSVSEFGAKRWAPGVQRYLGDVMEEYEAIGVNHMIWLWESSWSGINYDDFNFRHGPDAASHKDLDRENPIEWVLRSYWSRNQIRPSQVKWRKRGWR